jgi:Domain of unknown function (DUF5658)
MHDFREETAYMEHARRGQFLERRGLADRRARPTTLVSAMRWQGRRKGFRRAGEGHRAYVDCLAGRIVGLAVLVCVSSVLDALLTLLHLEGGGCEANPLMYMALAYGPALFIALKLSITCVAAWFLAAHQQFPLAYRGLHGLALGYGVILAYHLALVLCLV